MPPKRTAISANFIRWNCSEKSTPKSSGGSLKKGVNSLSQSGLLTEGSLKQGANSEQIKPVGSVNRR